MVDTTKKAEKKINLDHLDPEQYAWMIDTDKIADPEEEAPCNSNAVGMMGPRDAPQELLDMLKKGIGRRFKMYDDDGELYYEGIILVVEDINDIPTDSLSETYFGPLQDFGTPNAGAVHIKYKKRGSTGTWETL